MTYLDMVEVVAGIDPAAAVIAAVGARHFYARVDPNTSPALFAGEPQIPGCCEGTVPLLEHRISRPHVGFLFAHYLADAFNAAQDLREHPASTPDEIDLLMDDVLSDMDMRCVALLRALDDADPDEDPIDLYYRIPFWALGVPEKRIECYERAELPWPEALTFEMYGPPLTPVQRARLVAEARHPAGKRRRSAHLTPVR